MWVGFCFVIWFFGFFVFLFDWLFVCLLGCWGVGVFVCLFVCLLGCLFVCLLGCWGGGFVCLFVSYGFPLLFRLGKDLKQ